jgi:toxin-antitoxin system PIN domain toxin
MTFLFDVNALIALGFENHTFHGRLVRWLTQQPSLEIATCSITELGFARVLSQTTVYRLTVDEARSALRGMKDSADFRFRFLPDDLDISNLPDWVKTSRQTTDGHLVQLANRHGALLLTFDQTIPGSYAIR